jgi:hypothetical protein
MRRIVKRKMLQLLTTLQEAHSKSLTYLYKNEYEKVNDIFAGCQECALSIGDTIESFEDNQEDIIKSLEEYCEFLFKVCIDLKEKEYQESKHIKETLDSYIGEIYSKIEKNIKVILKVVFLPYKASMWTSLESIWRAAEEDEECEAKVVVIPYYTLDSTGNKKELCYERALFPDDIPIVNYDEYSLEKEQPDIVFIHNPYDGTNNVTRVPEQYYSYNIKPYTEQLVYSPYGMMGYYSPKKGAFMSYMSAVHVADKILVQSEKVKQIYIEHGNERNKIVALGSPKVDAIVKAFNQPKTYPEGWQEKLSGKKVFLLNTHLSYFIRWYNHQQKYNKERNYAEWYHEQVFDYLLNMEGCALIWRPHPLLKATLESRELYSTLEFVQKCEKQILDSKNGVLDKQGDYTVSFQLSDAFITTYSSMIAEYMISGKPIYIYQRRLNEVNCRRSPINYMNNYYKARRGEENQFPKFVQMVLDGEDPLYKDRMEDVHRAFNNLEGTIGKNIYERLKKE